MALTADVQFSRLARFSLTTANAAELAAFYIKAFGCRRVADERLHGETFRRLMGVDGDAHRIMLRLGDEIIELVEFDKPGSPYPANRESSALVFQHFAIVTSDMTAAWLALLRTDGWSRITTGSPQQLPRQAGSVTAFKFRDPEGHPLELLSFRRDHTPRKWQGRNVGQPCLGIDHSAISISDSAVSTAFYKTHGLTLSDHSRNAGIEQDQLDGLMRAAVEITALSPPTPSPHVELLCYENAAATPPLRLDNNDIAATRLVFESNDMAASGQRIDPDGHHLIFLPQSDC
jgi:catechol 2,3-dioxygenase-like lactoylglutathione lyase family enzyme